MLGVFMLKTISLYFNSGYHICIRKSDIESSVEEECIPLYPATDHNKIHMETNKEGTSIHYESSDGSL